MSGGETQTGKFYVQLLTIGKNVLTADDVKASYSSGGTTIARLFRNSYSTTYNHVQLLMVPLYPVWATASQARESLTGPGPSGSPPAGSRSGSGRDPEPRGSRAQPR